MAKKANPERQKWPEDKEKFDKNWLRIFGKKCPVCKGTGQVGKEIVRYGRSMGFKECTNCDGEGYMEKEKTT